MNLEILYGKTNEELKKYIDIFKMFNMLNQEILLHFAREGNLEIVKYINNKQELNCNRKEDLVYEQIKKSIEDKDFNKFKFFIENFKKFGILLEEIRKEEYWNLKLDEQLNNWLEENYIEPYKENINFLISCLKNKERKEVINDLINKNGQNVLFYACYDENLKSVKHLIEEEKLDINIKDNNERSILFQACYSGNMELVKYLVEEKKLDVNAKDKNGETVLFKACYSGNMALVEYLKHHNAKVSAKNNKGQTILFVACERNNLELLKYLLRNLFFGYIYDEDIYEEILSYKDKYSKVITNYLTSHIEEIEEQRMMNMLNDEWLFNIS